MVKIQIFSGSLLGVKDHKQLRAFKDRLSKNDIIQP